MKKEQDEKTDEFLDHTMRIVSEQPKYDACCRQILAEKSILSRIMQACLDEYQNSSLEDIAQKYLVEDGEIFSAAVFPDENHGKIHGIGSTDKSIYEGTVYHDLKFRARTPSSQQQLALIINVEAQKDFYPGYALVRRGLYYCVRMLSSQYGTEFTGSHYEKIKKVYSVWICLDPPKSRENTITQYEIHERNRVGCVKEQKEQFDVLSVIIICPGNPTDKETHGILKMLGVLFSDQLKYFEKCRILKKEFNLPFNESLEREVSAMCNLSERILEKGMEKGMEKGARINAEKNLRSLMKTSGCSAAQAMAALEIPEEEQAIYLPLLTNSPIKPVK